jgi:predicted RNase H-like HicB family nuclease
MSLTVKIGYDAAEHRYFVISSDIPGLNVEADTFEELVEVTQDVALDLVPNRDGETKIRFEREVVLAA